MREMQLLYAHVWCMYTDTYMYILVIWQQSVMHDMHGLVTVR